MHHGVPEANSFLAVQELFRTFRFAGEFLNLSE